MVKMKEQVPSEAEIFQALADAEKNYKNLLKINELISDNELETYQKYYYRDFNYPLGLVIKE